MMCTHDTECVCVCNIISKQLETVICMIVQVIHDRFSKTICVFKLDMVLNVCNCCLLSTII